MKDVGTRREGWGPAEMMAVAMSRLLRDGEVVFFGVASPLPQVATFLAKRHHAPDLVCVNIPGGIDPSPPDPPHSTVDPALVRGSPAVLRLEELFDLAARGALDTAFLGGAQIDRQGRLNLSVIGEHAHPKLRLPGGAGSASLLPTAGRTILWRTEHSTRTFVEKVDFVTAAGRVDRVVTPLCQFRLVGGLLRVETLFPGAGIDEVAENTGFPIEKDSDIPVAPPPTAAELALLDEVDPHSTRSIEFA